MTQNFATRFLALAQQRTPFCLGLDPTPAVFSAWNLSFSIDGLKEFMEICLQISSAVAIVKPQWAYFERFGASGLQILSDYIPLINAQGTLVLADCKKTDIGSTLTAYTQGIIGPDSAYRADAMTMTPYMGINAMHDSIQHADQTGCGLFIVVRSSNPEGSGVQQAQCESGNTVALDIAKQIHRYNQALKQNGDLFGPLHAVVGATLGHEASSLIEAMPDALILTPGIGTQGATVHDLLHYFEHAKGRLIPTASRDVLLAGPTVESLRAKINEYQTQCAVLI